MIMSIQLYYWQGRPNCGDYFSYWLCSKIFKEVEYSPTPNLVSTGSLLEHQEVNYNTKIWGSGFHNTDGEPLSNINIDNIYALRGKLSYERLSPNKEVVLGDTGLLASRFFDNSNIQKKYKIGIVTHWKDYDYFYNKYKDDFKIINMETNDVDKVLTEINECEFILSSSLHGIIFAHSFGIPALHLENEMLESQDNFKFKDYYSVLDISYSKCKDKVMTSSSLMGLYNRRYLFIPSSHCIKTIQDNLMKCIPFPQECILN